MRWFVFSIAVCVCAPLAAQDPIPDTTEAWRYFPLQVGDVWEYHVEIELVPPDCFPSCIQNQRRSVIGDSTFGDFSYRTILEENFWPDGEAIGTSEEFYRLDTLTAQIRSPYAGGELAYGGTKCGLDAPFPPEGSQVECELGSYITGEGYDREVQIGGDLIFTAVKSFYQYPSGNFRFGADIGLIRNEGCEGSCWDYQLTYANVGGVEYGSPFPVGIAEEVPESPNFRLAPAYPNPGTNQFFLDLTMDRPGGVSITVYDVLGRRVYTDHQEVSGGKTTIRIDPSDWPRGHYLVRATSADGRTVTARITRQ